MNVLIIISCMIAVASAGLISPHGVILQAQHLPVIRPNGVPLEPAENVAARAQHAAAHIEAQARNGDLAIAAGIPLGVPLDLAANGASHVLAAHGIASSLSLTGHGAPLALATHGAILAAPQHLPIIGPNGVPLEPAENVAARAQHATLTLEAQARNGDLAVAGLPLGLTGYGVPLDLAANGASHVLAAHGISTHGAILRRKRRGIIAGASPLVHGVSVHGAGIWAGPQHLPVIGPNGVPLEPVENVAIRAQHAALIVEAQARNGDLAIAAGIPLGQGAHGIASSLALAGHGAIIAAPQHLPIIGPNGVPLESAANVAARSQHAAAHIEAKVRNGDLLTASHLGFASSSLALAHNAGIHGIW